MTDTERLQKIADHMDFMCGRKDSGSYEFPDGLVHSDREQCTLDDLRKFIDAMGDDEQ